MEPRQQAPFFARLGQRDHDASRPRPLGRGEARGPPRAVLPYDRDVEAQKGTLLVRGQTVLVSQFEVSVVDGADRGKRVASNSEELSVGAAEGNDLQLFDPAVSRHHCTLRVDERGLELVDLASRNGTHVGAVEVVRGYVPSGTRIRIGQTTIAVEVTGRDLEQSIAATDRFGPILGASPASGSARGSKSCSPRTPATSRAPRAPRAWGAPTCASWRASTASRPAIRRPTSRTVRWFTEFKLTGFPSCDEKIVQTIRGEWRDRDQAGTVIPVSQRLLRAPATSARPDP